MEAFFLGLGISIQLVVIAGVITFAVTFIKCIMEISKSQKSIANSQAQLVDLLNSQKTQTKSDDD